MEEEVREQRIEEKMIWKILIWIFIISAIILFGMAMVFGRSITKGRINENKFAILFCGYLSLLFITISLFVGGSINRILLILVAFELLLIWSFGFLFSRWVFQKLNARNHS